MPKLSIITINLNNVFGLRKTMESVFAQTFIEYEYIIIDGGSTDGSRELIENHANKLVYWISEKDNGIFNAQNKGIKKAKGEYFLFLNSGDILFDNEIFDFIAPILKNDGIVYGDLVIKDINNSWVKKYSSPLSFKYFIYDTLPHQASFIHHSLFKIVGFYDEALLICADWKFFMDAVCKYGVNTYYVDRVISIYDYTGISSQAKNRDILFKEKESVIKREWKYLEKMDQRLEEIQHKYDLISNSRVVKIYFKLKKLVWGR